MTTPRRSMSKVVQRVGLAFGTLALAGTTATIVAPAAAHAATRTPQATVYSYTTLDDVADPTFNQLLGINSKNVIAGYFGSGAAGHPNQGYILNPPYAQDNYVSENFPGSVQTQVTAIDNLGNTAGFWVNTKGQNRDFIEWNGVFTSYADPKTPHSANSVNQLLGINDKGVAVGFYDLKGYAHAVELNQKSGVFTALHVPGGVSTVATGINNAGQIVGITTSAAGETSSFLISGSTVREFQLPGGSETEAFGINKNAEIVGSYVDGSGVMHGFVLKHPMESTATWQTIDDPNGVGSTVVNGLNNAGELVGFYTDAAGNTDGFLATP